MLIFGLTKTCKLCCSAVFIGRIEIFITAVMIYEKFDFKCNDFVGKLQIYFKNSLYMVLKNTNIRDESAHVY
jgi:hypothetical protein